MKICVYTISKNESQFVERFMAPLKNEADLVVVVDTGSTDDTVLKLQEQGAIVHEIKVDPWRFDIPRNISLQLVPLDIDVVVCIDLDEVLTVGWRNAIEKAWTPTTTRLRYPYVWNTLPDGKEGTTFWYDKITLRKGYRWVKPVHEILQYSGGEEVQTYCGDFKLFHFPDNTKSRGSYLPLLELATKEEPLDDRSAHYLGREYMYYGQYDKAIAELKRHLELPLAKWEAERAASMRYIGRCYGYINQVEESERWLLRAIAEAPKEREPWVELGKFYYNTKNFNGAYFMMKQALKISSKPMTYICEPSSWGSEPLDICSVSAFELGLKQESLLLALEALQLEPGNQRITNNIFHIKKSLES